MLKVNLKRSVSYFALSLSAALVLSAPSFSAENIITNHYVENNDTSLTTQASSNSNFTDAELEQMLAPIALYPDALLTHILIATTYPIEVVDAERWLKKNGHLDTQEIAEAAEGKDWDASVKALLAFPNVVKKLSEDLHWMRNLGDAFLQDEALVLTSVQILRQKADQAGNLENMDNVNVVRDTTTIIIEPRQADIIYVPYYDTRVVYGHWRWSHYPPIFWHHPVHYTAHHGPYYWHNPVHLSVGLFFGAVHWRNHHVVVHHHKSRYYKHHSKKKLSTSYQGKRWQHNPRHRKGVAYRTSHVQKKYRSNTPSLQQHKALRSTQKHFVNNNKQVIKSSSRKHQNLQHKLKVNRAVKIDKHKLRADTLVEHQSHKNSKWQQAKTSKITKSHVKTTKITNTKVKQRQDNSYINQAHTKKSTVNERYTQPVKISKSTYKKSKSSNNERTERRVNKRSHTNVSSNRKSHNTRTQQSRTKQHN